VHPTTGLAVLGSANSFTDVNTFTAGSASQIPVSVVAASGQTANAFEMRDSGGNARAYVSSGGAIASQIASDDQFQGFQSSGNATAVSFSGKKARGSIGSPTVINTNDNLVSLRGYGYDGSAYTEAGRITIRNDGAVTSGGADMPGRIEFLVTPDGSGTPAEAMRINNAGELLVGTTTDSGNYKLQVSGQIYAGSATIATSDGRFKTNVEPVVNATDMLMRLSPVSFDWIPQEPILDESGAVLRDALWTPDGKQVGFIAQDVRAALDDVEWRDAVVVEGGWKAVVNEDGDEILPADTFLNLAHANLIPLLVSSLQDAHRRIASLEARLGDGA
jgi:hypothetical protein